MEKKAIHHLLLKSCFLRDLGLFHGKMGISLFFYHYSQYTANPVYSDFAGDLLDDIWKNIHNRMPDTFESGLTGLAWGIEYLIQNNFVSGNGNEICEEIDERVMSLDPCRITPKFIEKELEGFLHYVLIRTLGTIKQHSFLPFDKMYRDDLFRVFLSLQHHEKINKSCRRLIQQYLDFATDKQELNYIPHLSFFINDSKIDENNILLSPLGLRNGVAGMLYKQINQLTS
ncbi:MAG: hypothetical protein LBU51_03035 [Bacteroidales bacterium]|jgi:lantibiotic modifying enzyme|nr:hypothetical protein [Bacteroidales bacterium]